jgi:hypothetical protein
MARTPIPMLSSDARIVRKIEHRAALISDPAEKLRYLRRKLDEPPPERRQRARLSLALVVVVLGVPFTAHKLGSAASPPTPPAAAAPLPAAAPSVWLVEEKDGAEVYSNGLRVERRFEAATRPRRYRVLERGSGAPVERTDPAGIVYHTTESLIAPFAPDQNDTLREFASGILSYVRRRELYHFLIDRFGRVFRLVRETDVAFHAGHSVWADERAVYIDLNDSFLGVSFEARTGGDAPSWTAAQVTAARLLTEMLRARYGIPAENCATHSQVSVNPRNMQLGYHTDWAVAFPFRELGLRDGYEEPNPAVALFGFGYGEDLMAVLGGKPWPGLVAAELQLVKDAASAGQSPAAYRRTLRGKYRKSVEAARGSAAEGKRTRDES